MKSELPLSSLSLEDRKRLDWLYDMISQQAKTFVGYPVNRMFDYRPLYRFLDYPINNVGDPFVSSTYRVNTRQIEREVIEHFAELLHAPKDDFWGYVNNGGTEGNLYGLYLGREIHPDGVLYFSQDRHYSIDKIARVLGLRHHMIRSLPTGEMDYQDLRTHLSLNKDRPAIVLATIGTTMKQGIDDIQKIRQSLQHAGIEQHYLHCDAALAGMILPFTDDPPPFDFREGIDSISVSGHKMVGSPIPCGVVLVRKQHVNRVAQNVEYVGIVDSTITGSRNGFSPLLLWYAIRSKSRREFRGMIRSCFEMADYAVEQMQSAGIDAWRNPHGITVVFPRPSPAVLEKWQIAVQESIGHIITMPHVDKHMIDALVDDMRDSSESRTMRQISLYVPDEPGVVADVAELLAGHDINIDSIDAETIGDTGVVILTVDRYHDAIEALKHTKYRLVPDRAILVKLDDRPGSLAELATRFKQAGINIHSLRMVNNHDGKALASVSTDNWEKAMDLVSDIRVG
ncbi:MAG: histidine decarboxylase [Opitutales bacterium]|nr:histidine decarboxylase [Opitutales bacterium]